MSKAFKIDESSLPSVFQRSWKSNPDPTALPFPRDNPPFALTAIDWQQLGLTDAEYTPHSWSNLQHLISTDRLDELKRWPSALKAYLAWTAHVIDKYGSTTTYLLEQRLFWIPVPNETGALAFDVQSSTPYANVEDFKILRNDWEYGLEPALRHIVVWLKQRLPVREDGSLSEEGRKMVDDFIGKEFREKAGEKEHGSKIIWFKNSTALQSVRSLEHVHVLVRDVEESVLEQWMR